MFIYVFLNLYGLILNFRHPETQVDFKQNLIFIFLKAKRDIFIYLLYIFIHCQKCQVLFFYYPVFKKSDVV
jgi:hypothetical protein